MSSTPDILEALRRLENSLFDRLGGKIETDIDRFRLEMNGRFDAIEARLDRLEQEYQMLVAGLRRVEEAVRGLGDDRARARAEIADLKGRIAALQSRVEEFEAGLADE